MDEQAKREKQKAYTERIVRWQQLRISQMSYTNNLFLGLNLGFLGFYVTQSGLTFSCICGLFAIQVLALIGLLVSFITGILAVINRLIDFRTTTKLVKKRKEKFENKHNIKSHTNIESINSSITDLETSVEKLGKSTWTLLKVQIWTFLIGSVIGLIYLIIEKNTHG